MRKGRDGEKKKKREKKREKKKREKTDEDSGHYVVCQQLCYFGSFIKIRFKYANLQNLLKSTPIRELLGL